VGSLPFLGTPRPERPPRANIKAEDDMLPEIRPSCDPDYAERLLINAYISLPRLAKAGSGLRVAVLAWRGPYEVRLTERDKGEGKLHLAIGIFHADRNDWLDGRSVASIEDAIDPACEFIDEACRRATRGVAGPCGSAFGVGAERVSRRSSACRRARRH
jgi:hypothetical protein